MSQTTSTERLSNERLRSIYDQDYVAVYDPHARVRMRRMLPLFDLPGDARVADFGCGNGVLLELLSPLVRDYVGVDFSEPFIRAAERRRDELGLTNGHFECGDIAAFCARHPHEFDAGFALDFSEHLYDDEFVRVFSAINGALKPEAPLFLHTPNAEYFVERLHERGWLAPVEGHIGVRDAEAHRSLLERCGFTHFDIRYLAHYLALPSKIHFLGRLPRVGRHFRARLFIRCWSQ
jgi:2-polyprenyl-6-hydroxyphenyl methylase / 3-demethylubiquinone-9 3-methyltransferase